VQGLKLSVGGEVDDAVHCLIFVIPCEAVTDEQYLRKVTEVQEHARSRGKPPLDPAWFVTTVNIV
jgi:hypothetical protein